MSQRLIVRIWIRYVPSLYVSYGFQHNYINLVKTTGLAKKRHWRFEGLRKFDNLQGDHPCTGQNENTLGLDLCKGFMLGQMRQSIRMATHIRQTSQLDNVNRHALKTSPPPRPRYWATCWSTWRGFHLSGDASCSAVCCQEHPFHWQTSSEQMHCSCQRCSSRQGRRVSLLSFWSLDKSFKL